MKNLNFEDYVKSFAKNGTIGVGVLVNLFIINTEAMKQNVRSNELWEKYCDRCVHIYGLLNTVRVDVEA